MTSVPVLMTLGALVGGCIGLTGVGGGSLMTPLLLMLGIPAPIAIGTDLWYASITKAGSAIVHLKHRRVQKHIFLTISMGSVPASLITATYLNHQTSFHSALMTNTLAVMLVLTGISLISKKRIQPINNVPTPVSAAQGTQTRLWLTWLTGVLLGVLVTLSSVGAGAIGVMLLMTLFPHLKLNQITGTDVSHAVVLTTVAGIGHWQAHHVDTHLLLALCSTSLPAMYIGTRIAHHTPDHILRPILGGTLLLVGLKFALF